VHGTAVNDDFGIHGSATDVLQAFDVFQDLVADSALKLHPDKQVAFWPSIHHEPPSSLIDALNERGITLFSKWMPMYGAAVGVDSEAMSLWALEEVNRHKEMFHLITHPAMHPAAAIRILRQSFLPKTGYLYQAMPPSITHEAAKRNDELTLSTFKQVAQIECDLPILAQFQIQLPCHVEGSALRRMRSLQSQRGSELRQMEQRLHSLSSADSPNIRSDRTTHSSRSPHACAV
jgi:hypothetical protein